MATTESPEFPASADVLTGVRAGVGRIVLNRPAAINALTLDMIDSLDAVLREWMRDPAVSSVELTGAGERGMCSGADVRALRAQALVDPEAPMRFLADEYRLDSLIADYPKPFRSIMHGITMGGGLGLSLHGGERVATASTSLAMPETTIGFFPDVGALYELSRTPGHVGAHLAMTGASIDCWSALDAGLVDRVDGASAPADESQLSRDREWIDACYQGDSASDIVAALEAHPDERARQAAALIRIKSPLSVCVSLAALRRAASQPSVDAVLASDLRLARHMMHGSDFVEGVRAQLVDKDRNPRWQHARIEDVPASLVKEYLR